MKITTFILFAVIMQVSASGFAQKITLTKKAVTFKQLFSEITKQTGYSVFYADDKIDAGKKINVNFKDANLEDVLTTSFKGLPITYKIEDKKIFVDKEEPSFIDNLIARFQAIDVRGKVVDSLGNGLAGANIVVKGSKGSTTTNANGEFLLKNVEEGAVITVSYLGYVTRDYTTSSEFNYVELQQNTSMLDQVQIQAYGKTSRRLSTGNIITIKAEDIQKQTVNNPLLALQGRVPNLVISPSSGLPGASVNLQLRGQNSLAGSSSRSEPLIMIDGVPYTNNLTSMYQTFPGGTNSNFSALRFINPSDIEQIDVLSDADATSIYGSRGGNGVILITTRKGRVGPTQINASFNLGYAGVSKKVDLLNTEQYLKMRNEAYINDNLLVPNSNSLDKNRNNFDLTVWDSNRYTDWQEEFYGGIAPSYDFQTSLSGGSQNVRYLISGNFNKLGYLFPGESRNETGTGSFSIDGNSSNRKLNVALNANYNVNTAISPSNNFVSLAVSLAPNAPSLFTSAGELNWQPNPNSNIGEGTWTNPYAQLLRTNTSKTNTIITSASISYNVLPSVTLKLTSGFNEVRFKSQSLTPIASFDPAIISATGSQNISNTISRSLTVDPQAAFNKKLGFGQLDLLVGGTFQSQIEDIENIYADGYTSDALIKNLAVSGSVRTANNTSQYKYAGLFGRATYNFNDKYILNLNARRDGSSKFGPSNQFGNFWSFGGAWLFGSEEFIKTNFGFLSFGKLRASYGSSGNDGIGNYRYLQLYEILDEGRITYQNFKPFISQGAVNPYYHWEDLRKLEVAVDFGILKDRILFSVSKWRTRAFDQLGDYPLPATAGNATIVANQQASIQNMGWDFIVNTRNVESRNFTWSTAANFGLQSNKLLSLPENNIIFLTRFAKVGEPFSGFVQVYDSKGINPANGLYQFLDKSGNVTSHIDNDFNDAKKVTTTPKTLGISNSLTFKGFSFDFYLQLTKQMGLNPLFDPAFINSNPGSFISDDIEVRGNLPTSFLNNWKKVGDVTDLQKFSSISNLQPLRDLRFKAVASDLAWVDASFIRLRTAAISYNVPDKLLNKIKIRNLRIFMQGQNLITITSYKGLDPEIQSVSTLPLLRTVTAGIVASF